MLVLYMFVIGVFLFFDCDGPSLMLLARFGMYLDSVGHVAPHAGAEECCALL